jgi:hypothetical protein
MNDEIKQRTMASISTDPKGNRMCGRSGVLGKRGPDANHPDGTGLPMEETIGLWRASFFTQLGQTNTVSNEKARLQRGVIAGGLSSIKSARL